MRILGFTKSNPYKMAHDYRKDSASQESAARPIQRQTLAGQKNNTLRLLESYNCAKKVSLQQPKNESKEQPTQEQ